MRQRLSNECVAQTETGISEFTSPSERVLENVLQPNCNPGEGTSGKERGGREGKRGRERREGRGGRGGVEANLQGTMLE